jgi:hypothetical protein
MSRTGTFIAIVLAIHLVGCSSVLHQVSPSGKAGPFLNSPLFLTVIGGAVVAVITQRYTSARASYDRQLAQENAIREKKIAMVASVANDVSVYVSTVATMKKFKLWLKNNPGSDAEDELGRPRGEVLKLYAEYFRRSLQTKTANSILAEVLTYYESPQVLELVEKEKSAVDSMEDSKTSDEIIERMKGQVEIRETLLRAMAKEIKQTQRHFI